MTDQQGTTSGFNIQSTGKADPALKGTQWSYNDKAAMRNYTISFAADDRNVAYVDYKAATYTVKDKTISFDYSQYIQLWKSMTVDRFIQLTIADLKKSLDEEEKRLKAEKDAAKKKALEQSITRTKDALQRYQNVTQDQKNGIAEELKEEREMLTALEKYATFSGTLDGETINNSDASVGVCCSHKVVAVGFNTLCYDAERSRGSAGIKPSARITVEKFPVYKYKPGTWELKKIVFKKDKINNR